MAGKYSTETEARWWEILQRQAGSSQSVCRFCLPDEVLLQEQEMIGVTRSQLLLILEGIAPSSARQPMRFQASREMLNRDEPTAC